jgi:hypothetical protein
MNIGELNARALFWTAAVLVLCVTIIGIIHIPVDDDTDPAAAGVLDVSKLTPELAQKARDCYGKGMHAARALRDGKVVGIQCYEE